MKAPIKQILVSNGRRHVPLGGYASPSAKSWLYKDLDFWPSGRRPLCIVKELSSSGPLLVIILYAKSNELKEFSVKNQTEISKLRKEQYTQIPKNCVIPGCLKPGISL